MILRTPNADKNASRAAERQMRNWAVGLEVQERLNSAEAMRQFPNAIRPFIAISRETGAGGGSLAERLSELLGWQIRGRELLDALAERYRVDRDMLEAADETAPNWVVEVLGKWLDQRLVTPSQYLRQLGHVVLSAARAESCIFVGRGAQFFLPSDRGLSVRLVAPLAMRISRIMELHGWGRDQAQACVQETDRKRREFIAAQFGRDIDDLHLYDLGFNRAEIDIGAAAELIVHEVRRRFGAPCAE